jgi:hypothetical protein
VVCMNEGVEASLYRGGEVVPGAPWRQLLLHRRRLCAGDLIAKTWCQWSLGRFDQTTRSVEPGPAQLSPPLAGGLRGSLALSRLMGPSCIELLCLCFGPILDHVGLSCVDLRVSLVVCHGIPRFRLLITEIHY